MTAAQPDFFERFPMRPVSAATLDRALAGEDTLRILFLWGHDCPNCDIAKGEMALAPRRFHWPDVEWLHDNVYDDPAMATRLGLHGIPAFFVFRGTRRVGRMSEWPGTSPFLAAIEQARGTRRAGDGLK